MLSNPGVTSLELHCIEASEGSASPRSHISGTCSWQGVANLDSSHAVEATKPLIKVMAPPHYKDVPTLATKKKNKGVGGHIIAVLKGCGERC